MSTSISDKLGRAAWTTTAFIPSTPLLGLKDQCSKICIVEIVVLNDNIHTSVILRRKKM